MSPEELHKYLKDLNEQRLKPESLLLSWKQIVESIEKGYNPNCLDNEYWNDLDTRMLIRKAGLDEKVRDLDERFKKATIRREVRVWESSPEMHDKDDFWCFGYPKKASGFFLEQMLLGMPENLKSQR